MISSIILFISAALLVFWGAAHLIATRSVIRGFGHVSLDNRRIITMEWIIEGVFLISIGTVISVLTFIDPKSQVSEIMYLLSFVVLNVLALISLFTGFKINFLPFRLCPFIFLTSAFLIIVAKYFI